MGIQLRIARHSLLLALRDPKGLIFALLMPLIVAALMGSIAPGAAGRAIAPATVLILNDDTSTTVPFGAALTEVLLTNDGLRQVLTATAVTDATAARASVATGKATALVAIPSTFTADLIAGRQATVAITTDPGDPTRADAVSLAVRSVADAFASRLLAAGAAALGAQPAATPVISEIPAGTRPVSAMQYNTVAAALIFVIVMAFMRAGVMLEDRSLGTLDRMLATPIRKGDVVAGQILGSTVLSLTQFAILVVGTRLILGVSWGPWLNTALLGAAFALASAGLGTAAAAVLKDRKAADQASGLVGNLFGVLAGSLTPIYALPAAIKAIGRFTPNYWAMQGFLDQMAGNGQGRLLLPVVVLVAMAAVSGILGARRLASR